MSRKREYRINLKCKHPDCQEWSFYSYPSQTEYKQALKRNAGWDWKCTRHNQPEHLLTQERLIISNTFTSSKSSNYPALPDLFWNGNSGFKSGAGWKAFANDFPEGTQIIETVQVILPKSDTSDQE